MKDLVKLYSIHSVSGTTGETEICDWICKRLDELGEDYERIDNTLYHLSEDNDVMLSAHLDQVETSGKAEHIYKVEHNIIAYNSNWRRTSLGADDKNGVWLILKLIEEGFSFDWIISESEEIGCIGISKVENFIGLSSAKYCIVLDRRGNYDILNKGGSTNYCQALAHNLKNFWDDMFTVTTGTLSDTQTICKYIESVNMSVAYHNPHTSTESTDYDRLCEIKEDLEKLFTHEFVHYPASPSDYAESTSTSSWRNSWKNSYYKGAY
jgi:di/tripeptidase